MVLYVVFSLTRVRCPRDVVRMVRMVVVVVVVGEFFFFRRAAKQNTTNNVLAQFLLNRQLGRATRRRCIVLPNTTHPLKTTQKRPPAIVRLLAARARGFMVFVVPFFVCSSTSFAAYVAW